MLNEAFTTMGRPDRSEIDTLRALACLALVSFHVVGNSPATGLELPFDHWLHRLNAGLVDLRMPLFSFLSGYVFVVAIQGRVGDWAAGRVTAKIRRLLLPLITVGTLFWVARDAMGQAQQPLMTIYVLPFAHFWFLQAIFLVMAGFVALVWLSGGRAERAAWVLLILGVSAWLFAPRPEVNVFSFNGALRLSGFFAAGFLAARLWPRLSVGAVGLRRIGFVALATALCLGMLLGQGVWSPGGGVRAALALLIGMGGCLALLAISPRHDALAWIGRRSYAIYLFHVFFTAGTIEAAGLLAPELASGLLWPLALVAGLFGPIALQAMIQQSPLTSLLCLGLPRRAPLPSLPVAAPRGRISNP